MKLRELRKRSYMYNSYFGDINNRLDSLINGSIKIWLIKLQPSILMELSILRLIREGIDEVRRG
jgi:hypothetical protein